jgi:hypothetical protein
VKAMQYLAVKKGWDEFFDFGGRGDAGNMKRQIKKEKTQKGRNKSKMARD